MSAMPSNGGRPQAPATGAAMPSTRRQRRAGRSRDDRWTRHGACRRGPRAARRSRRRSRRGPMRNVVDHRRAARPVHRPARPCSLRPGTRTSKIVIAEPLMKRSRTFSPGRKSPVQLSAGPAAVDQEGVAGDVGEIGRIHPHLGPVEPVADDRLALLRGLRAWRGRAAGPARCACGR